MILYIRNMNGKLLNKMATFALLILFGVYRIGMLPWITDTVMTFTNWNMHVQLTDFVKSCSTWIVSLLIVFFGVWWALAIVLGLLLINWVVFLIWHRFKGRQNG